MRFVIEIREWNDPRRARHPGFSVASVAESIARNSTRHRWLLQRSRSFEVILDLSLAPLLKNLSNEPCGKTTPGDETPSRSAAGGAPSRLLRLRRRLGRSGVAERLGGKLAGALGAVLLIVSALYNDGSHLNICDVPSAFFAAVCLAIVARLVESETTGDYLLAPLAIGAASQPLFLAHQGRSLFYVALPAGSRLSGVEVKAEEDSARR